MIPTIEPTRPHIASVGNAYIRSVKPNPAAARTRITGLTERIEVSLNVRFNDQPNFQNR